MIIINVLIIVSDLQYERNDEKNRSSYLSNNRELNVLIIVSDIQ